MQQSDFVLMNSLLKNDHLFATVAVRNNIDSLGCSNVGKTMLSQFISAKCPSIGRTCWGLVTYSCKRWDNIRTCYRIHIMCLAQHCPNMQGQRRATSHLYIVTTLSSQRWPYRTNKMSRCWPNVGMRLYLIVLNVCLS